MGRIRPMAAIPRAWQPVWFPTHGRGGAACLGPAHGRSDPAARAGRRGAHRVRSHRARGPRDIAASDGSPVDGVRQGRRCKHPRSAVKAPDKRKRGGAHPSGGLT
jgi:hypothetical protein